MPIHVEDMTAEVTAVEGELPLSPEQMEKLVEYVAEQLEKKQQQYAHRDESTEIRGSVITEW